MKTSSIILRLLPLLLLTPFVGGCAHQSTEGAMPGTKIESAIAPNATIHDNQVVFIDRDLQSDQGSKVAIEQQGPLLGADGGLSGVFIVFRNRTQTTLQVECRVQFFGVNHEPVEGPSAWQRVILPPLGVGNYKETSLGTTNHAFYYVEVREGT